MGFGGRPVAVCTVPWTLLAVSAGPDLAAVCAGLKREKEPRCCVRRLELFVSPSLKLMKDDSSHGRSFPPRSEPCIYGVLCVWLSVYAFVK